MTLLETMEIHFVPLFPPKECPEFVLLSPLDIVNQISSNIFKHFTTALFGFKREACFMMSLHSLILLLTSVLRDKYLSRS